MTGHQGAGLLAWTNRQMDQETSVWLIVCSTLDQEERKESHKNLLYTHLTKDLNAEFTQYNSNQFSVGRQERYIKEDIQAAPKSLRLPVIREMPMKLKPCFCTY